MAIHKTTSVPSSKGHLGWGLAGASCAYASSILVIIGIAPFFSGALAAASVGCFAKVVRLQDVRYVTALFKRGAGGS